jgi:hypothetical protein
MNSENRDMQTSWVGAGWSSGIEAIEADLKGTTAIDDDEWFYIDRNGGKTKIVKDNNSVLRLENNPSWKVELSYYSDPTTLDTSVTGVTIIEEDGSRFMFGDFQLGFGPKKANRCVFSWGGRVTDYLVNADSSHQICYRWDLSRIIDPYGVVLFDYSYYQEQNSVTLGGSLKQYTRA